MFRKTMKKINKIRKICSDAHTRTSLTFWRYGNLALLIVGAGLLIGGLNELVNAADAGGPSGTFSSTKIDGAMTRLYKLIEGSFGALIATSAGIGAIIASAFGGFKAAWALLVCSVGAFILRALVSLFFDLSNVEGGNTGEPPATG